MKFVFTEKKVEVPHSIKAYAEKKIGKLERYFKSDVEAYVTFSGERLKKNCEVTIQAGSTTIRVSESTSDWHSSIDSCVAGVERQIHKNKSRLEKRLRQGVIEREVQAEPMNYVEEEVEFNVVRTKRFSVKPMSVEEAILQMNLLNHEFFVFRNQSEDDIFSIVYRRGDGGYGLILGE